MQFAVTDKAAATFAREFYKRLCAGDDAGQVDVAVAYALKHVIRAASRRPQLGRAGVIHPCSGRDHLRSAATGAPGGALDPLVQRERLAVLTASLQASLQTEDNWASTDLATLETWRRLTERAEEAYRTHLSYPRPEVRQAAQLGLELVSQRLAALDQAIDALKG